MRETGRSPRCRFEFHKRGQLLIRTHNEPLSIVAMPVCNPDRSPVGINRRDAALIPTGFAEIVGNDFRLILHDPPGFDGLSALPHCPLAARSREACTGTKRVCPRIHPCNQH
jgi:hypothetical protein